jgi:hypothetical protein
MVGATQPAFGFWATIQSNSWFTKETRLRMPHCFAPPASTILPISNKMSHEFLSSVKHYLYLVHLNYVREIVYLNYSTNRDLADQLFLVSCQ